MRGFVGCWSRARRRCGARGGRWTGLRLRLRTLLLRLRTLYLTLRLRLGAFDLRLGPLHLRLRTLLLWLGTLRLRTFYGRRGAFSLRLRPLLLRLRTLVLWLLWTLHLRLRFGTLRLIGSVALGLLQISLLLYISLLLLR